MVAIIAILAGCCCPPCRKQAARALGELHEHLNQVGTYYANIRSIKGLIVPNSAQNYAAAATGPVDHSLARASGRAGYIQGIPMTRETILPIIRRWPVRAAEDRPEKVIRAADIRFHGAVLSAGRLYGQCRPHPEAGTVV